MTRQEQINECESSLLDAMINGDIKVLDELLHDNLIFNIPSGQTITKVIDIDNYRSGIFKVSEILATDRIINSIDDISIVAVTLYLKATYGNQVVEGKFRYLRIWKLVDDSWKVIAGSGFQIQ